MSKEISIDELWASAASNDGIFEPSRIAGLPEAARRYLEHAISGGTRLASAVRLRMHGEIKLRDWLPFTADEVIHRHRGFIWAASVKMQNLTIRGSDRLLDGKGAMRWKLWGIIPVMTASGPEITRSAIGRLQGEFVWLPSILCSSEVAWTARDSLHPHCRFAVLGEPAELEFSVNDRGSIRSIRMARWGNPQGGRYRYVDFGMVAEAESTFDGYTVPTRLRAGWHFGTDRFAEGEFFRATIDDAQYR